MPGHPTILLPGTYCFLNRAAFRMVGGILVFEYTDTGPSSGAITCINRTASIIVIIFRGPCPEDCVDVELTRRSVMVLISPRVRVSNTA